MAGVEELAAHERDPLENDATKKHLVSLILSRLKLHQHSCGDQDGSFKRGKGHKN